MSSGPQLHPLAAAYLERLRATAEALPRTQRDELIADIEGHLREATTPQMADADVLAALDRLGDPDEIVEAQEAPAVGALSAGRGGAAGWSDHGVASFATSGKRLGFQELAAIFLLLFGGFIFVIGWFAGLILLWASNAWRLRDKLIGTLCIPGGLAASVVVLLKVSATTECAGPAQRFRGFSGTAPVVNWGRGALSVCNSSGGVPHVLGVLLVILALSLPVFAAIHLGRQAGRNRVRPA